MENYTKNGLFLVLIGMIISMIGTLLSGIYYTVISVDDVSGFLSSIGLSAIGGIGGIISFIGGILFLVGRKEFGKRHQKFVMYALIILVVGIVITIVVSIAGTFLAISGSFVEGVDVDLSGIAPTVFITIITGTVIGGLVQFFALYELENDLGRRVLYITFIVSILVAVFIGYFTMDALTELLQAGSAETSYTDFTTSYSYSASIARYASFGIISNILWLIAIYIPYKRIISGDLVPQPLESRDKPDSIPERVCPNCNQSIPNDANHCPYCGKSFENYM